VEGSQFSGHEALGKVVCIHRNELPMAHHSVATPQTGWSVSLAPSLFLSGFTGRRPTNKEIQGVMSALSSLIADIDDETKDGQS
jgi:hypothetical protein